MKQVKINVAEIKNEKIRFMLIISHTYFGGKVKKDKIYRVMHFQYFLKE